MRKLLKLVAVSMLPLALSGCPIPCDNCNRIVPPEPSGSASLGLAPIAQQTPVWCWATSAEMVFRYYQMPTLNASNYQCGIVAAYFGGACLANCGLCVTGIGPMSNMYTLINGYGPFARQNGIPSPTLSSQLIFRQLSIAEVATEIDAGRPIVAGISASSAFRYPDISEHIVVIVGYDLTGAQPALFVNDPYPYDLPQFLSQGNPYIRLGATRVSPGRYRVLWETFVGPMAWANSIYHITRL